MKSDKGMANFSDRSLLKNLGHWLGMITLAKNKPILLDDINLKMLLVEAYNKGHQELLFTVPFIAKIIESCAKSKVCSINFFIFFLYKFNSEILDNIIICYYNTVLLL